MFPGSARRRVIKTSAFRPSPRPRSPASRRRRFSISPRNGRRSELEKDRERRVFFFFLFALSSRAAFLPRKMRLLNLDPRRFPIGRAAAGFSFSLFREEWVAERMDKRRGCQRRRAEHRKNREGWGAGERGGGGWREEDLGVGVVYLRLKRRISRGLRRDSLLKMSFRNREEKGGGNGLRDVG